MPVSNITMRGGNVSCCVSFSVTLLETRRIGPGKIGHKFFRILHRASEKCSWMHSLLSNPPPSCFIPSFYSCKDVRIHFRITPLKLYAQNDSKFSYC